MSALQLEPNQPVYLVRPRGGFIAGIVVSHRVGNVVVRFVKDGYPTRFHTFGRDEVMTPEERERAFQKTFDAQREAHAKLVRFITLHQPWASAIAWGWKSIETRDWSTPFRGWLGIHAAAKVHAYAIDFADSEPCRSLLTARGETPYSLPRSAVVAVARVYDCVPTTAAAHGWRENALELAFGNYAPGRYAWLLRDVRPLPKPVTVRGAQGLWACDWLPTAINVALGEELLPTTETGRLAYYRQIGEARTLEAGA